MCTNKIGVLVYFYMNKSSSKNVQHFQFHVLELQYFDFISTISHKCTVKMAGGYLELFPKLLKILCHPKSNSSSNFFYETQIGDLNRNLKKSNILAQYS